MKIIANIRSRFSQGTNGCCKRRNERITSIQAHSIGRYCVIEVTDVVRMSNDVSRGRVSFDDIQNALESDTRL